LVKEIIFVENVVATNCKKTLQMATEKTSDFECGICSVRFGQNDHLREHINNTHENIKNPQKQTLNEHERIAKGCECDVCSAKIERFECDICSATFNYNSRLQQHIDIVHNKLKKFHCHYCDKKFGYKIHLQRHKNIVHKKNKKF
jgi:uncharacterized Zn-finger protein